MISEARHNGMSGETGHQLPVMSERNGQRVVIVMPTALFFLTKMPVNYPRIYKLICLGQTTRTHAGKNGHTSKQVIIHEKFADNSRQIYV